MNRKLMLALATAGLFLASTTFQGFAQDKEKTIKAASAPNAPSRRPRNAKLRSRSRPVTRRLPLPVQNDVAKKFHKSICQSTEKVTATER
jgi:hypothetical protein